MNGTIRIATKLFAIMLAILFLVPTVPALWMGHGPANATVDIPAVPALGKARNPSPVRVGTAGDLFATSLSTERSVLVDKFGYIYVVWSYNDEIWFSKSTDSGQTFSTPFDLSNDTGKAYVRQSRTPVIVYNGSAIFVGWSDQAGGGTNQYISLRRTVNNGTTWTPATGVQAYWIQHPTQTDRRLNPDIAVNNTDVYVISNNDLGGGQCNMIYLSISHNAGQTWDNEITVVDGMGGGSGNNPQESNIEVSNDDVYIAYPYGWVGGGAPADIYIKYSALGNAIDAANDFSQGRRVDQGNSDSRNPSMIVDGDNIDIVWEERYNNDAFTQVVYKNSSDNGLTWTPATNQAPINVSRSNRTARFPSLIDDGTGLFCVWADQAAHVEGDVVYSEYSGYAWSQPFYVTNDTNVTFWPSAHWKFENHRLDIVWTNGTNPYDVLYEGYSLPGSAPTLDWTAENNYVTDGLDPETGTTGHTYIYRVKYTDADDDAPLAGHPKVMIDRNIDGDYADPNEMVTMTAVNAADTTYTDGKLYTYSTRLPAIGTYTYQFGAMDSNGRYARGVGTTQMTGPTITSVNEPPMLFWLEDGNYLSDGLDPETGFTDTNFTYKVVYFDVLNEAPANGYPKVYIDMDGNGVFTDPTDQQVAMSGVSALDTSYDNGKVYYYTTTLAVNPVGYKYMFYAQDLVGLPAQTANRTGPIVTSKGTAPVLAPTGETGYSSDGVEPGYGADTTEFVFKVKFSDADGDLPATGNPKVGIDLNRDGNITVGEKTPMVEQDTLDVNTKDGKIYIYNKVLGALGMYSYQFEALDTNMSPSNVLSYSGPNVNITNKNPTLKWLGAPGFEADGLEPGTGFANQTSFRYRVLYYDSDNDAPLAGYPMIWIDANLDGNENTTEWHPMTASDPTDTIYNDDKKYEYSTTLPLAGIYRYKFAAKDSRTAPDSTSNPTKVQLGPTVELPPNLPPVLALLGAGDYNTTGVFPANGNLNTDFVYKVKYIDLEGDMPGDDFPRVYIDAEGDGNLAGQYDIPSVMTEEDALDTNVVDGKVYMFTTKLPIEGQDYQYRFRAEDGLGNAALGTGSINDQVFDGPSVVVNKEPLLQFIGTGGFTTDGVDPDTAFEGSTFTFKVTYKDHEGDTPKDSKVYLRIDINKNKAIDTNDPKVEMTEANPQDTNYQDGKEYLVQYQFVEDGTYGYRFEAWDSFGGVAGGPAGVDFISGPIVTEPVPNRDPTLTFTGEQYFQNDAVNPITGLKGTKFTFRVRYMDLDNDAPANGYPRLLMAGQTYTLSAADGSDTNYVDGKFYYVDVTLDKAQVYTHTFEVKNAINQTATMGPLDGPVVTAKAKTPTAQMLPDMLWLILLIIIAVVVAIVGYLIGAKRKRQPEPEYYQQRPRTRAPPPREPGPTVPLETAEVHAPEPILEKPAEAPKEEPKKEGPKPEEEVKVFKPGGEPKKEPEQAPGPPPATDAKTEMKAQQSDSEAPADDKDAKEPEAPKEEKKPEGGEAKEGEKKAGVDDEIDSILSKLEK